MASNFKMPPTAGGPTSQADRAAAEEQFYDAAATRVQDTGESAPTYPWEGLRSDKETELFNLRLTEQEKAKLDYIAANTPLSRAKFAKQAFLAALDAKIKELTEKR